MSDEDSYAPKGPQAAKGGEQGAPALFPLGSPTRRVYPPEGPPLPRGAQGAAAPGEGRGRGFKFPTLPRMNLLSGGAGGQSGDSGGGDGGNMRHKRQKSVSQLAAHYVVVLFLIVIYAGLIIWLSTLAVSYRYRVDTTSDVDGVKVNDALEVFGTTSQAHVRIGSYTASSSGVTQADEVLEFGTYHGKQFVPKSFLRSQSSGTLELVTQDLALAPQGGIVGVVGPDNIARHVIDTHVEPSFF